MGEDVSKRKRRKVPKGKKMKRGRGGSAVAAEAMKRCACECERSVGTQPLFPWHQAQMLCPAVAESLSLD